MRKNFNKYIITLLLVYAFWSLGLPLIFSATVPWACEKLSERTKFDISIVKPSLRLYPIPVAQISAQDIYLKVKNTDDSLNIKDFRSKIRILPLLSGKLHVNSLSISDSTAFISLDHKIVLDKNFFKKASSSKFVIDEICLSGNKIRLLQGKDSFNYYISKFYFKRTATALLLDLQSDININDTKTKSNIKLYLPNEKSVNKSNVDILIENLDVERLGKFLKNYLPKDFVNMRGVINVKADKQNFNISFNNFAVIMKDSAKSIIFPKEFNVDSKFDITNKAINFESVNVKSKKIDVNLSGNIKNYLDPALTSVNFNVVLNSSKVEDIINLLPPFVIEEFNIYRLKYYKFYGDVVGNFSIKGDIQEPDINGEVYINNGVLIKPIKNAKGAVIKLDFIGKYVNFDVIVPAGGRETVWVKGGVELYNIKYSDMRIWSTQNVNLVTAEEKVVPLHEILNFVVGPVPIMDISGFGNIDMTVKGNRQNPHVWGYLNFRDVNTRFKDIPDLSLKQANAILTFDDEKAHFETKEGFVNNRPISISGDCNLSGNFDFDVQSSNQEIGYLYNALETASMIEDIQKMLPKLDKKSGLVNLKLKVFGSIIDIDKIAFNQNLFSKGSIELLGNSFGMQGVDINNTKGVIGFDGTNANVDIKANIGKADMFVKAKLKENIADLYLSIPKLNLLDLLPKTYKKNNSENLFIEVEAKYKGKVDEIELDKIDATTKILGGTLCDKFKLVSGLITIKNGKAKISDIVAKVIGTEGFLKANFSILDIDKKPSVDGLFQLRKFDLNSLNSISEYIKLPEPLNNLKFNKGKINLNCNVKDNKVNAYTDLGGVELNYDALNLPIKIINGSIIIKNNNLRLNKINVLADNMPILLDGNVADVFVKQRFNLYMNSKPKQEFIDKYFNRNQIYPLKIKGDIVYSLRLKGTQDDFNLKADVNMAKDSSIYHLGAIVGDIENSIVLNLDTRILNHNMLKIKEFSYDKIIPSLGTKQTRLNMLKAKGGIEVFPDDLVFDDLYIRTQNPTDARIFNIIFRKPNIKQGQFTSDLRFNGKLSDPKLIGDFHIFETNIPFMDTTMKNIALKFRDKYIDISSKGEILGNDISIQSTMKNKLSIPYYVDKANLYTNVLDLNYIIDKLKLSQVDELSSLASFEGLDLGAIVIKNLNLKADNIYLRNIEAKNFVANVSYNENRLLRVNDLNLSIANGSLGGQINYNAKNSHTDLKLKANDIDANALTYALFDLDKQIYGDLTGDIDLSCNGESFDKCMQTLNGDTSFNVIQGRLPKLGSLEYLLKAGNLVKGGITSVSINNIIDLITPLKTGDFSSIYGSINIKDGIAERIEIATKGKDLNIYISGNYNFSTADAQMEVLGLLSKKISTMFGPLGNLSLNSLFNSIPGIDLSKDSKLIERINKIPGIEISGKDFRKFVAEIKGNINGEDYVTSFKWIN